MYETWSNICHIYFDLDINSKKAYLQWFPFSKLSSEDGTYMASQEFFEKYIKTASLALYPEAMYRSENYLQKSDGSFRNSSLVSPILYLLLQSIGKEISKYYVPVRNVSIDVHYAGNLLKMRAHYKQDYDSFFKSINAYITECQYFIKTDITNFFSNINLDILIDRIDKRCNRKEIRFTPTQLKMLKELLSYCGDGRFPIIENSVASSFFATVIYLDEIDQRIFNFINEKVKCINAFKIVRYVDDMYILINSSEDERIVHDAYNQIRNEYSSILKEYGLALNAKKCCIRSKIKINEELKKSLYDEYFRGIHHEIEELFEGAFECFLSDLISIIHKECIDAEKYNTLIATHFTSSDIEFTPIEVFNYFIYENDSVCMDLRVITLIRQLLNQDISFIRLDPKRLTVMIMKTKDTIAIKSLLNQLFTRNRNGMWNSYDTSIAISYLIQSEFRHIDLLNILARNNSGLQQYYSNYCKSSFLLIFRNYQISEYVKIIGSDWKAYFLYFMFWAEKDRHNTLAEFAYYKNFFDRFTADMAFYYELNPHGKPDYKAFYKESQLKNFYSEIENSRKIIQKAHKLRNANPLSHSSAELIDRTSTTSDLKDCIKKMNYLIEGYLKLREP